MSTTTDELIAPERWGKDHWSTLAYIETRLVDHGPYTVGIDPRMKTNRRHLRIFADARAFAYTGARSYFNNRGQPAMRPEHATTLRDGTQVPGHDDWMCLQDLLAAGLLKVWGNEIQPGRKVRLSPLGLDVAARLRAHKASGGNFGGFVWPVEDKP